MAPNPNMPRSAMPKPSGPPPAVLLYALCLVPITAFAGWVVTYGQDEEALERKLRAKYGKEIRDVESKKQQMSEVYMAAIKHPGSNPEQEERLQQILRGGKGEVKRHHAIDRKYYGTDEGLEKQKLTEEEMAEHQEEERQKMKRVKKKLKKKKKRKKKNKEGDEESSSSSAEDDDTDSEPEIESRTIVGAKKKAVTAGVATAGAVAAATAVSSTTNAETQQLTNKDSSNPYKSSSKKKKRKKKKDKQGSDSSFVDMNQIATLTAVAGVAALVGFLVGGGSRRQ